MLHEVEVIIVLSFHGPSVKPVPVESSQKIFLFPLSLGLSKERRDFADIARLSNYIRH